jgi:ABC-type transport system involved in cytochrome bd biosynthesis fused ATPase/permease subunit
MHGFDGPVSFDRLRTGSDRPLPIKLLTVESRFHQSPMSSILSISNLTKTHASGSRALKGVNLEIRQGEISALLGRNRGFERKLPLQPPNLS